MTERPCTLTWIPRGSQRLGRAALCFLGLLFGLGTSSPAEWTNPSERYAEAYQQYLDAECPLAEDEIQHFVYFARDRQALHGHPMLDNPRFAGAQIMVPWALLEPSKGQYDFSILEEDLETLEAHGKRLFLQLQDTTFNPRFRAIPDYLRSAEYDDGAALQRSDDGIPEGWVAKRWKAKVRERFALLLLALGEAFDGRLEGINLQETAIGVSPEAEGMTPAIYAESIRANMMALKKAFPTSTTLQYANFMLGEWLPWEDEGHLRSIYAYGESIGVGLGAPDLMVRRKGQLNHALAMMHENDFTVPLGIAVQDGNYTGLTGADFPPGTDMPTASGGEKNLVPMLHAFAQDFLKVRYMFWSNQEPYFEEHVLPCFGSKPTHGSLGF